MATQNIRKDPELFVKLRKAGDPPVLPEKGKDNTLITSALPYVNNVPHLGNVIGSTLSADVFARYSRTLNRPTLYVCGTDEYGTATETKALEEGVTPQALCDRFEKIHREVYEWFDIGFDYFGRTSTPKQTEIVQDIYLQIRKRGLLSQKTSSMTYCEGCQRFLADRFVEGTCPDCGYDDARGDQCDNCTHTFSSPVELISPRCKRDKTHKLSVRPSSHMYLQLDKIQDELKAWIAVQRIKGQWEGNVIVNDDGQIVEARLKEGLRPSPITRDLTWGVPVAKSGDDEEDKAMDGKVMYVWFDAPIGYISITANYTKEWEKWWKAPEDVKLFQFMGKDNVYFHTVSFPCSLFADGRDWTKMHRISSTDYLNYESGKFSKSRNVGVFGPNAKDTGVPASVWRYYLLSIRPETGDSVFAWKEFVTKNNSELLNNLGNFVNRVVKFVGAKFESTLPGASEAGGVLSESDPVDGAFFKRINDLFKQFREALDATHLREGLSIAMKVSGEGNAFLQDNKLDNALLASNPERCARVVLIAINLIYALATLVHPYMPATSDSILRQVNSPLRTLPSAFSIDLLPGHTLGKAEYLFVKIDEKKEDEWRRKYGGEAVAAPAESKSKKEKSKKALEKEKAEQLKNLPRTPEVVELEEKITSQGAKVAELKKSGDAGDSLAGEVATLRSLKKQLEDFATAFAGLQV